MPNERAEKLSMTIPSSNEIKKTLMECYSKLKQTPSEYGLNKTDTASSFGILSVDSVDLVPQLDTNNEKQKRLSEISTQLMRERQLAHMTLQKTSEKSSEISSKYLKRSVRPETEMKRCHTDSTISERDFSLPFIPDQMSTPRASTEEQSDVELKSLADTTRRMSQAYDILLHKMRTSDISIPDVCQEIKTRMVLSNISNASDTFIPAELAADKLLADELSWRREKDIPGRNSETFLPSTEPSFDKVSVSEFFQQKSDDISNLIPNMSPNKSHSPIPLIDDTSSFVAAENSMQSTKKSLSVSGIAKMLAEMNTDDSPNGLISLLCKQQKGKRNRGNKENAYLSTNDLSTQQIRKSISKESRHKSLSPIGSVKSDESGKATNGLAEKSLTSLRSGSSLSNLPDGKLPIEATKTELSWGCIKLGKTAVQVCKFN